MFKLTAASGQARRVGALGSLAVLLLLSACEEWKLGWPSNLAGSGSGSGSGVAFAQGTGIEYPVVFNCGSNPAGLVPGQYDTLLNIYNPGSGTIPVTFRASLSIPPGFPNTGTISGFRTENIDSFRALEVSCENIRFDILGGESSSFISGLLLIQSGTRVEIITTYTAGGTGSVNTVDVERIQAR